MYVLSLTAQRKLFQKFKYLLVMASSILKKQTSKSVRIKQRHICIVFHILSDGEQAASNAEVVEEALSHNLHMSNPTRHPLTV